MSAYVRQEASDSRRLGDAAGHRMERKGMRISLLALLSISAYSIQIEACAASDAQTEAPSVDPSTAIPDRGDAGVEADAEGEDADAGETTLPCVPETLCPVDLLGPPDSGAAIDFRARITVIRGRSPSDVWAAGAAGAVAHFDGTTWKRTETGTQQSVRALWLRDAGEMAFTSMLPTSTVVRGIDLEPVAGQSPSADGWLVAMPIIPPMTLGYLLTSAWAAPDAEWLWGTVAGKADWDSANQGSTSGLWRARIDPVARVLEIRDVFPANACKALGCWWMTSIHGASADDLWAVGRNGSTFHITGAQGDSPTATAVDSRTWALLNGVWTHGKEAFAVGSSGTIRHYPGTGERFDIVSDVPATEELQAVWGTSPSDVWAVGNRACVLHYDGTQWSRIEVRGLGARKPDLYTVWTGTPGKVWIGGDGVVLTLGGEP